MKKLLFIALLFCGFNLCAQTTPNFDGIQLAKSEDYKKADSAVLVASKYLLSTPFDKTDVGRLKSIAFVIKWMSGTPDYSFSLDQNVLSKITKGSDDLLGLYMACMAKYSIEHKSNANDEKLVRLNAVKALLAYAEIETNKVPNSASLKKLIEANKKGNLERELG